MIIITSESLCPNAKLKEIKDIINNTILEHNKKYGDNYCRKLEIKYNIQFFDKIKTKQKKLRLIPE